MSTQDGGVPTCPPLLQALSPPQTLTGSPVYGSPVLPQSGLPSVLVRTISGCSSFSESSNGPQFRDIISSKTLFYLKSTLNASFYPDYDFSDTKSEEFSREPSVQWVKDAVRSNLSHVGTDLEVHLWEAVDEEIQLKDCDIYRYKDTEHVHLYAQVWVHVHVLYMYNVHLQLLYYVYNSNSKSY